MKFIKKSIGICGLSLVSTAAAALTLDYPLDLLLDSAKDVVNVEIISGQLIQASDGTSCFSVYTARVTDRFKGNAAPTIKFGSQEGLSIDKEYLLVLNDTIEYTKDNDWLRDINFSGYPKERASSMRHTKLCEKLIPGRMVAAFGIAAMPIENPYDHGYAVKVPAAIIGLPTDTKCSREKQMSFEDGILGTIWVKKYEMHRVLKEVIDRPTGTRIFGSGRYQISGRDCAVPN